MGRPNPALCRARRPVITFTNIQKSRGIRAGCYSARCEKSGFRLRALHQKHHSHTTQTSGLVPTQPADSDLLKAFRGVTLWQKISRRIKYQLCSCSQHKAQKLIHSHVAMLACRHLTVEKVRPAWRSVIVWIQYLVN